MQLARGPLPALAAAAGSAGLLLAALGFQYLGGLPPCPLCIWQRWPHLAAVAVGLAVAALWGAGRGMPRGLAVPGAAAAATSGGVGVYHSGIERGWWPGPDTCAAPDIGGLTTTQLLDAILAAPVVRCEDVAWEFMGLSMASWNAVASFALALLWLLAARRPHPGSA
ncbi:MAG: disulfide bond formation protein B [Rhodobacteraceae bacterium]|jgi:disulfide bond formation protein DsbB|nr:disulfide bond formation protein B [Paracoccaceae bacterium]